ncbi:MAG: single-stranded DNA-binding protein [Pseudomonadota bacterium]
MINKAILVGHLGSDPEVSETDSGHAYARFSLATSEAWKDKQSGERRERTEWHRVVCWGDSLRKICHDYLKKGSKVFVQGKICTRSYEKDGVKRYATEIVIQGPMSMLKLLDRRDGSGVPAPHPDDYGSGDSYSSNQNVSSEMGMF